MYQNLLHRLPQITIFFALPKEEEEEEKKIVELNETK